MIAPEWTARAFQYANRSTPATSVAPTRVVDENRLIAMPGASVIAQWMYLKEALPLSMNEMATIGDHLGEVLAPQLRDKDKQSLTQLSSIPLDEVHELLGRDFVHSTQVTLAAWREIRASNIYGQPSQYDTRSLTRREIDLMAMRHVEAPPPEPDPGSPRLACKPDKKFAFTDPDNPDGSSESATSEIDWGN